MWILFAVGDCSILPETVHMDERAWTKVADNAILRERQLIKVLPPISIPVATIGRYEDSNHPSDSLWVLRIDATKPDPEDFLEEIAQWLRPDSPECAIIPYEALSAYTSQLRSLLQDLQMTPDMGD